MTTDYSVTLSRINQDAFNAVQRMYANEEPLIQEGLTDLGAFGAGLNQRLNELQNSKVVVPSEEELHTEEVTGLNTYWELNATMVKAHELMRCLNGVMTLLNQPARAPEQQDRLNAYYPEITKVLTEVDTVSKGLFDTLKSHYQHVDSIYQKMSQQMVTTSWEMMKFSDIVANKGKPLSYVRLMYNYIGTPAVRTLTAEEFASLPQKPSSSVDSFSETSSAVNTEELASLPQEPSSPASVSAVADSSTSSSVSSSTDSTPNTPSGPSPVKPHLVPAPKFNGSKRSQLKATR
jgi:hypothetical protein